MVLGAVNIDLVVRAARLPRPGETVVGGAFERHQGGKGGNQAVAAARALRSGPGDGAAARALRSGPGDGAVAFLGAVGDDAFGAEAREALEAEGVDLSFTKVVAGVATGVALIVVDDAGENQIAVAPGANAELELGDVDAALADLADGSLVLASLEVPLAVVHRAAERCRERGAGFVLNPAPVTPGATDLLPYASHVIPNEVELAALAASAGASAIVRSNPGSVVIVTRGADGATITDEDGERSFPASPAQVVDTTGAGDCFNGVLAASLFERRELETAVRRAIAAAGLSVTKPGARDGMPTRDQIDRVAAG